MNEPTQTPVSSDGELHSRSGSDLLSASILAALAAFALVEASSLESPDGWTTAPGLLPIIVSGLLFLMAVALAVGSWRRGGVRDLGACWASLIARGTDDLELRRTLVLAVTLCVYVFLVGWLDFDWRLPTPLLELQFSSYELVSIAAVTFLLAAFGSGRWLRCLAIASIGVEVIAWVFRYGFAIVMPAAF